MSYALHLNCIRSRTKCARKTAFRCDLCRCRAKINQDSISIYCHSIQVVSKHTHYNMKEEEGALVTPQANSSLHEKEYSFDLDGTPSDDRNDIILITGTFDGDEEEVDDTSYEILPDDEDEIVDDRIIEKDDEESIIEADDDEEMEAEIKTDDEKETILEPTTPDAVTPSNQNRRFFQFPVSKDEKRKIQIKFPKSVEKAFRATIDARDELDGVSSDESDYDDDSSIGDDSHLFEDDAHQIIDFSALSVLPNSFLSLPPGVYDYLDQDLVHSIGEQNISMFAWEHHLLAKGLMQLMAERDHIGVEGDVDDTSNVLKMGALKKRNKQQLWKVKFVEIRKGNLTFYDDTMKAGRNTRTVVHLRKRTCRCEAVKTKDGKSGNFVFELIDEGGPKRVWMAKSEEEMIGWIKAINQARIGETEDSVHFPLNMAHYKNAIDTYNSVRSSLHQIDSQNDYMTAASSLLYRQSSSSALRVPMQWVREELFQDDKELVEEKEEEKKLDAPHQRVKSTVSDFWNSLCNLSLVLNGYSIEGNSAYSAERIMGTLSRCILEFDKVNKEEGLLEAVCTIKRTDVENLLTEAEAVSYARSILTGILRNKSRNEAFEAVEKLVLNENVVSKVELQSSEPLHIDVSFAGDGFAEDFETESNHDLSGWIPTRSRKHRVSKERFFVLSEGILSMFTEANPRPYGLRGQFVLKDATLETVDGDILEIKTKKEERLLMFDDRGDFVKWKSALERSIDPQGGSAEPGVIVSQNSNDSSPKRRFRRKNQKKSSTEVGERAYKTMKEVKEDFKAASGKVARRILPKKGENPGERRGRRRRARRRPTSEMLRSSTRNIQYRSEKIEPTVQVVVEWNSVYQVLPKGSTEEALMFVKVKSFQAFLLSGGPNGRLARGDELLEMEFTEGDKKSSNHDPKFLELPTSL